MVARFLFNEVVLQPTSLCNLDCKYCYLPERTKNRRMLPEVTVEVARMLEGLPATNKPISVLWHCGEPLATGYNHFSRLIEPFAELEKAGRIKHIIQTNATLINERWCEFFLAHGFDVGVSLDGPEWANHNRVNWNGQASLPKILQGLEALRQAGIPLNGCAVVGQEALGRAAEFYQFFVDLGFKGLSINIEERTGVNTERNQIDDSPIVQQFWTELLATWKANPVLTVREFYSFFEWWNASEEKQPSKRTDEFRTNLFPTVGWNGDVVFLSPELQDTPTERYQSFVVGNLCTEPFLNIIGRAKKARYVLDFMAGQDECKNSCIYYSFCGGGYASPKFFELGTTAGTETAYCRTGRQRLFDAVYSSMQG